MTPGRIVALVVGGLLVLIVVGLWVGLSALFSQEPDRDELRMPTIGDSQVQSLSVGRDDGATKQEVFSTVGRGKFDTEQTFNASTKRRASAPGVMLR